jgi:RNA polymerase sigma-70 factor, ECF subfamily
MDDGFIKQRLKKQDRVIFESVFTYYYSGLCAFARQFVQNRELAEDLVQDFFVEFWTDCPDLEIAGSVKNYFFTAIKNRSLDHLKHLQVRARHNNYIHAVQNIRTESFTYAESELNEIIERAMKQLQPRCRQIFEMSRFKGLSNKKIAESLNISQRTVELQISKALKVMRQALSDL